MIKNDFIIFGDRARNSRSSRGASVYFYSMLYVNQLLSLSTKLKIILHIYDYFYVNFFFNLVVLIS